MAGPESPFHPDFPDDFLRQANTEVRRRTASYQSVQRYKLVLLLNKNKELNNEEAGRMVGLSGRQVRRWRKRWTTGDFTVEDRKGRGRKFDFSPCERALVKAIACELVSETRQPLSRQSLSDVTKRSQNALGKTISRTTVGRILETDAIKPWQYKYWIFPRDPEFAKKAEPILELYEGFWEGQPLGPKDHILSADEKTSIQARIRCHSALPPASGKPARIENEYKRGGALQYLAAWDVRRGYVTGRCEAKTGIKPFNRLVEQVMDQEPYSSGERIFWIADNGSSHRGASSKERMREIDSRITLLHTPIHASWLNQVEIYFSIIQRKVLNPNDFENLDGVRQRLALYEELSNKNPKPFSWNFDRKKLSNFLKKLEHHDNTGKSQTITIKMTIRIIS